MVSSGGVGDLVLQGFREEEGRSLRSKGREALKREEKRKGLVPGVRGMWNEEWNV